MFISYRRADGVYAAGWIHKRLEHLDEITELRTAFRDSDLRFGDDFHEKLTNEVARCDVLIAVIGAQWRGAQADGSARILDDDDWVGREVGSALENGKRIVPVLVSSAEPLHASDLRPEHRALADIHAVRFNDAQDLEELVLDLRTYLDDLDRERARTAGLDQPIELPTVQFSIAAWLTAVTVAIVMGVIGWFEIKHLADPSNWAHFIPPVIEFMMWGFFGVVGYAYFDARWPTSSRSDGLPSLERRRSRPSSTRWPFSASSRTVRNRRRAR